MNHDPKGFYKCLGVAPDANSSVIKSAYRSLAKKLHPDINPDPAAAAKFTACSDAYAILSDPEKRAQYDSAAYEDAATDVQPNEALEPIHCSRCHKATAQPRNVVFRSVVSLIITTITTPIQGIFCSDCARKASFRASLTSGVFGWWGVPWGPILTIKEILRNASGGDRKPALDDRLTYYNAVAFASRGQFNLAHAIARQLRGSSDEELALDALRLVDELERRGVPKNNPSLKSGWTGNARDWAIQAATLLVAPAALCLFIFLADGGFSYASPAAPEHAARSSPLRTNAQPLSPVLEAPPPIVPCSNPPKNGTEFGRHAHTEGGHRITIKNGGTGDALVKVRDVSSGRTLSTMFVKRGEQAAFNDLPDGRYAMMFATGDVLDKSCQKFSGDFHARIFPNDEIFATEYRDNQVITSDLTLTLYNVPGGNVRPEGISEEAFNAG